MNIIKKTWISLGVLVLLSACGSNTQSSDNDHLKSTSIGSEKSMDIIESYFKLKDDFVASNAAKARQSAEALINKAKGVEDELVSEIASIAEKIASSDDINFQREQFFILSESIYELIIESASNDYTIYKQYCPMAMEGQGAYWLSKQEEIFNPYFGDKMLHCGSIKEEL